MQILVLAFGKLKTPGLREAADYYTRLIGSFLPKNFEEIELKPVAVPDKSSTTRTRIQNEEAAIVQSQLKKLGSNRVALILLDETGENAPTEKWAELISTQEVQAVSHLVFCVGSSLGFAPELRKTARGILSLGRQTLPHELARVVLLEQIYRALSVKAGHPYHNSGS